MRIVAADWLPYCLPLRRPWQTSRGRIDERCGRLLRLMGDDGRLGWGDCAPWPEFGIGEDAALAFAEECACLDLAAQQAELPLNAWLSGQPPVATVAVNANLGEISGIDDARLASALDEGYPVLKIKVGSGRWADEIARLRQLARRLPAGASFRLDANAAWDVSAATGFLDACTGLPVECVEEPLRDPDPDRLAGLQQRVPFPLAIDESCRLLDAGFFRQPPVRRLVLKPARHGGLLASMAIALRARAAGLDCIVTSSLESACGVLACAQLAAAVAPQAVHGLATGEWLLGNTGQSPAIADGRLALPVLPGLGFIAHPAAVDAGEGQFPDAEPERGR